MGMNGKDDVNNCSSKIYMYDMGTGMTRLVSNDETSSPQGLSTACEPRRNFFSISVIARVITFLFVLSLSWPADATTPGTTSAPEAALKRRQGPAPERCEDYVARTRHTYLDTAQVVEDSHVRHDLLATYNHLRNDKLVIQMCAQPKFLVRYDLHLSMVELQRQYILTNR
jgi:hypothetical protein